ncbi:MAG: leucine-rich repeat protein [Ruminococcus sp.]|nr:leucine-rich repeat protein [Ruminococcus sp.]
MRKFLLIFTALVLSLTLVISAGAVGSSRPLYRNDDYIYEILEDGTAIIHYYIGYDEEVVVPSYIDTKPVSTIGERAFYDTKVRSVTISEGISTLMDEAFFYCYELEEVILPASLDTVGLGVFRDCKSLKAVTFTGDNAALGGYMFYGCVSLEDITLPNSTQTIPIGMFGYCESLREIKLPRNLVVIDSYGFYSSGLISIKFTPSLSRINKMAFAQSKRLESVIPSYAESGCSYVASDAFDGCAVDFTDIPAPTTAAMVETTVAMVTTENVYDTTEAVPYPTMPPSVPVPPAVEDVTDPTEVPEVSGDDSTMDEVSTVAPDVGLWVPEVTTQDGYYMGSAEGFVQAEEDMIASAKKYVISDRQELLSLAWNVRMLGDSNMDGKVNIKDATAVQRYTAGLITEDDPGFDYKNSDANTDGQVNIKDATAVQKLVAGLVESLY